MDWVTIKNGYKSCGDLRRKTSASRIQILPTSPNQQPNLTMLFVQNLTFVVASVFALASMVQAAPTPNQCSIKRQVVDRATGKIVEISVYFFAFYA